MHPKSIRTTISPFIPNQIDFFPSLGQFFSDNRIETVLPPMCRRWSQFIFLGAKILYCLRRRFDSACAKATPISGKIPLAADVALKQLVVFFFRRCALWKLNSSGHRLSIDSSSDRTTKSTANFSPFLRSRTRHRSAPVLHRIRFLPRFFNGGTRLSQTFIEKFLAFKPFFKSGSKYVTVFVKQHTDVQLILFRRTLDHGEREIQ